MNRSNVLNAAKAIFSNIEPVNENVFKGELFVNSNKPAGIFYLDFTENIEGLDFNEYQEKILSDEYFKVRNNLQWNYYYLLFQDNFDRNKKNEIEKNDKYARKYIFTESEFFDFFNLEKSSTDINSDIVIEWKKKLDDVDLQEVYSNSPVAPSVDRFLENNAIKNVDSISVETTSESTVLKVDKIKRIILKDTYRLFPVKREFDFGKVNLIKGINGVGKTSLFESIEMLLCGKTKRNPDKLEADNSIEAIINENVQEFYTSEPKDKFRKRDLFWYSNNYSRDNNLQTSFNRYNYFNTDAAYSFSNSNNESEIRDALFNLVLGVEYTHISERSEKFYIPLKTEFNRLDREVKNNSRIIEEKEALIARLKKTNGFEKITQSIISNLKSLKIKQAFPDIVASVIDIQTASSSISLLVQKIRLEPNSQLGYLKIKELDESNLKEIVFLETALTEYDLIHKGIQELQLEISDLTRKIFILNDCQKYFANKKYFEIGELAVTRDALYTKLLLMNQAQELSSFINLELFDGESTISSYQSNLNDNENNTKDRISKIDTEIKSEVDKLSKVNAVVKQIKMLGQEFVEINPAATECPLCKEHHIEGRLKTLLLSSDSGLIEITGDNIQKINQERITLSEELVVIQDKLVQTEKLKQVNRLLKVGNDEDKMSGLIESIRSIQVQKNLIEEEISKIDDFFSISESENISISEFTILKEKVFTELNQMVFSYENKELFEVQRKDCTNNIDSKHKNLELKINLKKEYFKKMKSQFEIINESRESIIQLQESSTIKRSQLSRLVDYYTSLSNIVLMEGDFSLDSLDLNNSFLIKNIDLLKSELNTQHEIISTQKIIDESKEFIKSNELKYKRISLAKEALESLTSSDGNAQLETFFNTNLKEIIDIFKSFHTPKEFENIQFVSGQLYLNDSNGKPRRISEISTGQRSALALSIFISINRKLKNGPKIVLFDDPVSYIDDFNALSFLDFLRYFVLKENKQIFFATANLKLANLFEKKFSFLDDEFKLFHFDRQLSS